MDAEHALETRRTCAPELLDSLPHDHPDAVHSRRDLRLVNRFMMNPRWFRRTLPGLLRPGDRVLEIGAGTGELCALLNRDNLRVDGLDLCPSPPGWPASQAWHRADLTAFQGYGPYEVVIGNLIFHQFTNEQLAALGATLRVSARVIAASEPLRRRLSQRLMAAVAPLLGANHVTLHDAHLSIASGFCGDELPRALGLSPGEWDVACGPSLAGAYRMVAVRRPTPGASAARTA